jgi:hypothetical protein
MKMLLITLSALIVQVLITRCRTYYSPLKFKKINTAIKVAVP